MSAVDFAAAKAVMLSAVVSQSMELKRNGREWVGCCPFHPDRTPSFTISDERGFAHCFGCGWHGDAADFVAGVAGCGLREAVQRLGVGDLPQVARQAGSVKTAETTELARRIWRAALPIKGTPAQRYLTWRGIHMNLPPTLRFSRLKHPDGGVHPCLAAAIISPERTLAGVQRTFLTEEGHKANVSPVKMSLGRVSGCAIRLAPVATELIVCEGVEDGLTVQQELGRTVWVATGASMLPAMQFPTIVESIVIAADNDSAGEREAKKAAASFAERGLRVRIMRPENSHKDWNDTLRGVSS